MNEYQEPYEKEISLTELLLFCLKKWRLIVIAMLVTAAAAGVYKYSSTVRSNQQKREAQALAEKENSSEQGKEEVISNPNIEYYNLAIDNAQQELDKLKEYMDSSVIMQLESYHLDTGTLSFYINTEDITEVDKSSLIAAYESFVKDGRLARTLLKVDDSIAESELQYLISFEGKSLPYMEENYELSGGNGSSMIQVSGIGQGKQNVFSIQITAKDAESCKAYTEAAKEAITAYAAELQSQIREHELQLLSEAQTERIDQSIQSYQNGILSSYTSAFAQLKSLQAELKTVRAEEGETIVVGEAVTYDNPVSSAVKFAVVGLVLGAFLAAFVLVVIYLMSGKLQSTDGFREEFGMPLLSQITKRTGKKRAFGFVDGWITRIEEGAYADITYEEQLKIAAANLKAAAAKEEGLKKIMLAGTIAKDEAEAFREEFAKELPGIALSSYERIVFQASALEQLDQYDGVIFLEKKGESYTKLIKKEYSLVTARDIKVLGAVVL